MKKIFKPRARMLLQLGNQLIKNENIAIAELVKNSYDADANNCTVTLINVDSDEKGEIIIEDDGIGMTPAVVEQIWLEPGADFKDLILKGQLDLLAFSYTAKRTPIGEKGIGRFGVHKLGDDIEMITKSAGSDKEIVVKINWKTFKETKYLEDATFDVTERNPKLFINGKTGTYIRVKELRNNWSLPKYKDLSRTIFSLNSPFQDKGENEFSTKLELDIEDKNKEKKWKKKMPKIEGIKDLALWSLKCTISGNKITKFRYKFVPYERMDLLKEKTITEKDPIFDTYKKLKNIDLSAYRIGEIKLEMYVFYLGNKIIRYSGSDSKTLNNFLKENGGVRVYRDGMRLYNYGEREDDWLDLDQQRVSNVGGKIGNKLILGAVFLNRRDSLDLVEKTNREGFVETEPYIAFKKSVLYAINAFNTFRQLDKIKIRELYEIPQKSEPVLYDVDRLKDLVKEKTEELSNNMPSEKKEELSKLEEDIVIGLDDIKKQYIETHDILVRSAGAGLNLSTVIHEIDKRMKELEKVIDILEEGGDINILSKTKNLVLSISKLIENYSVLVSNDQKKTSSLKKVVNDAIFSTSFRFSAHETEVIDAFEKKSDTKISCVSNIIIGAMLNIFDNSLHWLNAYEISDRKIYIDFIDYDDEIGVLIADNGKGFRIPPEDAVKPFISLKVGGTGLGLHIVNEMMKIHGGKFIIRNSKEVDIPKEFLEGAITELIFKKEK